MCGLFFWICCIFITCNIYGSEITLDPIHHTNKRKYDQFTYPISAQEHFDKGLELYSKYMNRPQKLQKMIVYKNCSIKRFYLALKNSEIPTTLLHTSLFYLDCLSSFTSIKSVERLLLRRDAGLDDYSLVLKLLSTTSRLDLYDQTLTKILEQPNLSLYDLTQNDYLERPLSSTLWQRICQHPQVGTKTLVKYGTKLKTACARDCKTSI